MKRRYLLFVLISLLIVSCNNKETSFSSLTIIPPVNGSVILKNNDIDINKIPINTLLEFEVYPDNNYKLDKMLIDEVIEVIDITSSLNFKISEPKEYILNTSFIEEKIIEETKLGTVEIYTNEGGTISTNINEGKAGEEVILNINPNENYELKELKINDINVNLNDLDNNTYIFILNEGKNIINGIFSLIKEEPDIPDINNLSKEKEVALGNIKPGVGEVLKTQHELKSLYDYYYDVNLNLEGEALRKELQKVTTVKTYVSSYKQVSYCLAYTDENIYKPGKMYGIYDGKELGPKWDSAKTWNKEHIWCDSRLKDINEYNKANKDIHNLRAANKNTNGDRGNAYYSNKNEGGYYPNLTSNLDFRGDVARECFYMYTNYDGLILSDNPNNNLRRSMGKLTTLIEWHKLDPVDTFEKQRNMKIYEYQGNRNPFIDIPQLVDNLF